MKNIEKHCEMKDFEDTFFCIQYHRKHAFRLSSGASKVPETVPLFPSSQGSSGRITDSSANTSSTSSQSSSEI